MEKDEVGGILTVEGDEGGMEWRLDVDERRRARGMVVDKR
jgi:hypothetical protein